ncbi:hypothetical protein AB6A40_007097 [Gnathostoma spinigerum]|uniref:Uncharacterized protein n=1 Tax=Gnathostoma spinigerum TaxID=75299 RepID=A0ABD6EKI4_9BILA
MIADATPRSSSHSPEEVKERLKRQYLLASAYPYYYGWAGYPAYAPSLLYPGYAAVAYPGVFGYGLAYGYPYGYRRAYFLG